MIGGLVQFSAEFVPFCSFRSFCFLVLLLFVSFSDARCLSRMGSVKCKNGGRAEDRGGRRQRSPKRPRRNSRRLSVYLVFSFALRPIFFIALSVFSCFLILLFPLPPTCSHFLPNFPLSTLPFYHFALLGTCWDKLGLGSTLCLPNNPTGRLLDQFVRVGRKVQYDIRKWKV
jgi:hypothetical protein